MSSTKVLVTGANGYIGAWVIKYLLEAGYEVRGTVRDPSSNRRIEHLRKLPGAERLEFVALDLENSNQESFDKAVEGCALIAHTASPLPTSEVKNEDELIKPAVHGTLCILRACLKADSVQKVVITSSSAAIGGDARADVDLGEKDWTDVNNPKTYPYPKSKTLAERSAWDFHKQNKPKWSLTTINPVLVLGPALGNDKGSSVGIAARFLNHEMPMVPRLAFGIVDVREVAIAHVRVLEDDAAIVNGRRFILSHENHWMSEIGRSLKNIFGPMGYNIPTREAPDFLIKLISFFDAGLASVLPSVGKEPARYDNTPSREILKIEYRSFDRTLSDMGHSLVFHGIVKPKKHYQPPRQDWTPLNS